MHTSVETTWVDASEEPATDTDIPVYTEWARFRKANSILRASAGSCGLPRIAPSRTTVVSDPITMLRRSTRAATVWAFCRANRCTYRSGNSPAWVDSSMSATSTEKERPLRPNNSFRRGELEARIIFGWSVIFVLYFNTPAIQWNPSRLRVQLKA